MDKSVQWPSFVGNPDDNDKENSHLIINNGVTYAGQHLLLDIWGAQFLNDIERIEKCFHQCIKAANATLLHLHLHHFSQGDGVSGVAVLAESHISIHTWPEKKYAAFDVFMCGDAKPHNVIPIILQAFDAKEHKLTEFLRGDMSINDG